MAVMTDTERQRTLIGAMRTYPFPGSLTKTDVRAAIDAADSWADSNAASYNTALPAAFKNTASAADKAMLLAFICMRRAGLLRVTEDG